MNTFKIGAGKVANNYVRHGKGRSMSCAFFDDRDLKACASAVSVIGVAFKPFAGWHGPLVGHRNRDLIVAELDNVIANHGETWSLRCELERRDEVSPP